MIRLRHLDSETTSDLVAHAGISIFEVVGSRCAGLPEFEQFARQSARGTDHRGSGTAHALHRADHLSLGRPFGVAGSSHARGVGEPFCSTVVGPLDPILGRPVGAHVGRDHLQAGVGVT